MLIRKMRAEDYEEVYALWMSCAGMGLNDVDDSREGIERFLSRNPDTCFVAEEGSIVGVILTGNDGRRGYIYHTAVDKKYQSQGIGKQLVHTAREMLGDQVAIVLLSAPGAMKYYPKIGLKKAENAFIIPRES